MAPKKKEDSVGQAGSSGGVSLAVGATVGLIAIAMGYFLYRGREHFKPPVLSPLKAPKMTELAEFDADYRNSMLWGSYRSGLYFGMRTRTPKGLLVGLLWFDPDDTDTLRQMRARHEASQGDGLQSYGWIRHDGRSYGVQRLIDGEYNLTLSMVKSFSPTSGPGGDWAVRVQLARTAKATTTRRRISVVMYVGDEDTPKSAWQVMPDGEVADLRAESALLATGGSAALGGARWSLNLRDATPPPASTNRKKGCRLDYLSLGMETKGYLLRVKELMLTTMWERLERQPSSTRFHLYLPNGATTGSDLAMFQATCSLPSTLDWTFTSSQLAGLDDSAERVAALSGEPLSELLRAKEQQFEERFQRTFPIAQPPPERGATATATAADAGADGEASAASGASSEGAAGSPSSEGGRAARVLPEGIEEASKAALSNLLGSMGYFYGSSLVRVPGKGPEPQPYWPAALFSAVPSRSFFPRGFLWDEGFHQLLVQKWDPQLSRDVIAHWLDLMNSQGWIPREQILGEEARTRVPDEFVVQDPSHANPPSMVLPLGRMVRSLTDRQGAAGQEGEREAEATRAYLRRAWPRLEAWYHWFNTTQAGPLPTSYRWHGRDANSSSELNPKTLTSGLDDYPRASHPDDTERHLDLRCWMALASQVMADLGSALHMPAERVAAYRATAEALRDLRGLKQLHYDEARGWFLDWGTHTEDVSIVRKVITVPAPVAAPGQAPQPPTTREVSERVVRGWPLPQYVPNFGYVSLFPLLMQLLPAGAGGSSGSSGAAGATAGAGLDRELLSEEGGAVGSISSGSGGGSPAAAQELLLQQLRALRSEALLWSGHGLRSLATTSSLYKKYNTLHDAPYWRGQIWININYLALRALRAYGSEAGGEAGRLASELHDELRNDLLDTLVGNYRQRGYLYEQYDDGDGHGLSSHPFTGWTALLTLIAAMEY